MFSVELSAHLDAHEGRDGPLVCCVHRELVPLVTSLVLLVPAFVRGLEKFRYSKVLLDTLGGAGDSTFKVEFQVYSFNPLHVQVFEFTAKHGDPHQERPRFC